MVHPPRRVRPPPYAGRRPGQEQARRSQDRGAPACYAAAMKRSTFSAVSAGHSTAIGAAAILMWAGLAPLAVLRQKPRVWITGVGGLFGYHLLYFLALRAIPPVAVTLINYLWPILIVLMSSALPGHSLRWRHVAGTGAGLLGTALLVLPAGDGEIGGGRPIGY